MGRGRMATVSVETGIQSLIFTTLASALEGPCGARWGGGRPKDDQTEERGERIGRIRKL